MLEIPVNPFFRGASRNGTTGPSNTLTCDEMLDEVGCDMCDMRRSSKRSWCMLLADALELKTGQCVYAMVFINVDDIIPDSGWNKYTLRW